MRTLAVDYGKVRVGLAISDAMGLVARPLEVVPRPKKGSLVEVIVAIAKREEAERIVVGLPLKLDGSEGIAAEAARSFAKALEDRSGLNVVLWDERLSTTEASRRMRDAGVSSRQQRGTVDKVAAAVILRSYLTANDPSPMSADEAVLPDIPTVRPHPRDELRADPSRHRSDKTRDTRRRGTPRGSRRDWME